MDTFDSLVRMGNHVVPVARRGKEPRIPFEHRGIFPNQVLGASKPHTVLSNRKDIKEGRVLARIRQK